MKGNYRRYSTSLAGKEMQIKTKSAYLNAGI